MENIEALQAIERGEKLDQETLLQLNQAHLIDVAEVTNMQSSGREIIYIGLTPESQRLLKASKSGPLISDTEREIILAVVREFLDRHRAASSRALLKKFKSPITPMLQRLRGSVLEQVNNTYQHETYLPKTVAFYHCGDSAALAFARKSTILVLNVLRNLFDKELEGEGNEQRQFTAEEVEAAAGETGSLIERNTVFTGLYLAQEFGVFTMIRRDEQQVGIVAFTLNERVYETSYLDWDEHIRRSNISAARTWEHPGESSEITLPPLSAAGLEAYVEQPDNRKIFLVHGHAEEPRQSVSTFLRAVGLQVIILHEQANQGQTIIEKLEHHSDVAFAVVLLTPDDIGASALLPETTNKRARQNVILELGYFLAKLGRKNVCCLFNEGVELPSDYHGVLYVLYDRKGAWRWKLVKELSAAGIEVNSQSLSGLKNWDTVVDMASAIKEYSNKKEPKLEQTDDDTLNFVKSEIERLDKAQRQALRLLAMRGSMTDYLALKKLNEIGVAGSHASILPGLQNTTNLVHAAPGQHVTSQAAYELNWEIKPEFRQAVKRYFSEQSGY